MSARLQKTIDEAIEAARSNSAAEVLLLMGWDHSWAIDSIAGMLSVLPIPVYLLPDENVSRYLDHRAVSLGTLRARRIQRAPLTSAEQLFKRCFDLAAAISVLAIAFTIDGCSPLFPLSWNFTWSFLFHADTKWLQRPRVSDREVPQHARA